MKERPLCAICSKPALVLMLDKYFCGECVAKWDKQNKEKAFEMLKESLKC